MTTRGHARPDDEPGRPAEQDGQSMAYQLTSMGISVLALLRTHSMHGYKMFQTLVARAGKRPERAVYEITDAWVEAPQQRVAHLIATPVHEFPQFAVAPREVDILGGDAAAAAVDDRIGVLKARAAEITAFRDASVTPDGYLVAFDYLLTTMQAELTWRQGFAGSVRSGRLGRQQTDGVAI